MRFVTDDPARQRQCDSEDRDGRRGGWLKVALATAALVPILAAAVSQVGPAGAAWERSVAGAPLAALSPSSQLGGRAADGTPQAPPDLRSRLDRFFAEATRRREFSGAVLVARDGQVLLRKGYGYANVARRTPNRPSTRFRISSLTSELTAVGLLQLQGRGKLQLDGSVCVHVSQCPARWRPLTVRMLLLGRSGLPQVLPRLGSRSLPAWTEWLRARPMRFDPGSGLDRGHARFLLAAYVLERASGMTWIDYLERRIFAPSGMRATGFDRPHPARATPYFRTRDGRLRAPATFPPLSTPDVAYGLLSTVGDMYRFVRALHRGALLPRDLLEELGGDTGIWSKSWTQFGHGPHGTADGWYAGYKRALQDGQEVLVLAFSNLGGSPLGDLVSGAGSVATGWPPPRTQVAASLLARYVGRYSRFDSNKGREVTAVVSRGSGGTLRFGWNVSPRSSDHRLRFTFVPFADDRFFGTGLMSSLTLRFVVGTEPAEDRLLVEFRERPGREAQFLRAP